MAPVWMEVSNVKEEKRCELVLSGAEISKKIEVEGLDSDIFHLSHLNFLEISHTCLELLPDDVSNLTNLTSFVLRGNILKELNENVCLLTKLKFLDVSDNKITRLPDMIGKLTSLQTLNLSTNHLTQLPALNTLIKLQVVNFAQNEFENFPIEICDPNFTHLTEIIGSNNKIKDLPSEIENLTILKTLELGNNNIVEIPGELAHCSKLKDLNLKGNNIKDRRLAKLVDQCHTKQVLEYVRNHCPKRGKEVNAPSQNSAKVKGKSGKQKKNAQKENEAEAEQDTIKITHVSDSTPVIITLPPVHDIRPYVVGCILHNIDLSDGILKKFIALQTKLHDTICEKRTMATIATHDMKKIQGNITYTAMLPEEVKIVPLGKNKTVDAATLYSQLSEEADALRKEKKRSTYSGIHKFLYLLKDKPVYPCLLDETGQVISFPPITNSDGTKISIDTTKIFMEVTGNSLPTCKKIMDITLYETLKLGLGGKFANSCVKESGEIENGDLSFKQLLVEQVRVVDEEGHLRAVYPSRTDLSQEGTNVIRD